jgi:hypothetical protein
LHAYSALGTLPTNMPPAQRRPDVSWLPVLLPNVQALLDQGQATRVLAAGLFDHRSAALGEKGSAC